jgi:hypothetical protein
MRLPYFFFFSVCVIARLFGAIEKRCISDAKLSIFVSSIGDTQNDSFSLNRHMSSAMTTAETNFAGAFFISTDLQSGDCLLANTDENIDGAAFGQAKNSKFLPCVLFSASDGSRHYAAVDRLKFESLAKSAHKETGSEEILNFKSSHADLLILYVICPKDRNEVCKLTIKDRGKWVRKANAKLTFDVLARSDRQPDSSNLSQRISIDGDTPQGIYYIWGSMYSPSHAFGGQPRLDLDAALPPINIGSYEVNSYLMSQLVPNSARSDYWIQEWPLAFKMGRNALRLHGSQMDKQSPYFYTTPKTQKSFLLTSGCMSAGKSMPELLETLGKLGLFSKETIYEKGEPVTRNWRVTSKIGRAFVIVKDQN